jgi:hypothetical protein
MPADIYTKQPIETDSEDHILPSFLGGRVRIRGRIDKGTRDLLARGIDARLDEALQCVRVPLDARSAVGEPPNVPNEQVVRDMLRKHARGTDNDLDELVNEWMAAARKRLSVPPEPALKPLLWECDPYRATAKVVCNLFAEHDPEAFLLDEFDAIRNFVVAGVERDAFLVQIADAEATSHGLGPLDHLVRVGATASGEVVGLVVYFGVLAFVIRLGHATTISFRNRSYRVDQIGRSDRVDDPRDLAIAVPSFAEAAARSDDECRRQVRRQVERLVPILQTIQRKAWLKGLILPHWQRLLEQKGNRDEPTADELRRFSEQVAKDIVAQQLPPMPQVSERRREAAEDHHPSGHERNKRGKTNP